MRVIPTKIHGAADYVIGIVLILSPWLFGFAGAGIGQWLPVLLGIAIIVYSLLTDYEYGYNRMIAMPVHLGLDIAVGVLLLLSPWLFGFASMVFWPHVIIGLFAIGAGVATDPVPGRSERATSGPV